MPELLCGHSMPQARNSSATQLAKTIHVSTMSAKPAGRLAVHQHNHCVAVQVQLYAELQPEALLPFLAASQSYSLEPALAVCERHGLVPEQVTLQAGGPVAGV